MAHHTATLITHKYIHHRSTNLAASSGGRRRSWCKSAKRVAYVMAMHVYTIMRIVSDAGSSIALPTGDATRHKVSKMPKRIKAQCAALRVPARSSFSTSSSSNRKVKGCMRTIAGRKLVGTTLLQFSGRAPWARQSKTCASTARQSRRHTHKPPQPKSTRGIICDACDKWGSIKRYSYLKYQAEYKIESTCSLPYRLQHELPAEHCGQR